MLYAQVPASGGDLLVKQAVSRPVTFLSGLLPVITFILVCAVAKRMFRTK